MVQRRHNNRVAAQVDDRSPTDDIGHYQERHVLDQLLILHVAQTRLHGIYAAFAQRGALGHHRVEQNHTVANTNERKAHDEQTVEEDHVELGLGLKLLYILNFALLQLTMQFFVCLELRKQKSENLIIAIEFIYIRLQNIY